MRFFAPDRPRQANGTLALRLDGAVLPHISVIPSAEGEVALTVWLRETASGNANSFSAHSIKLPTNQLRDFFDCYTMDPEETLAMYFGWQDRKPWVSPKPTPKPRPTPVVSADLDAQTKAFADLF